MKPSDFPFKTEPHVFISKETDVVISFIKKQNCILNAVIKPFPDISELEKFAVYHYWSFSESVNVFQVVGSASPDYTGCTWIDMLKTGKKMPFNLKLLSENPEYYFSGDKKEPDMHYTRIDDEIYISGEGNHRTAIAKVLFFFTGHQILHGIEFNEYRIDHEAKELYSRAKETLLIHGYPVDVEVVRKIVKREDTAGWKKDYFDILFRVKNYRYHREKTLTKDELKKLSEEAVKRGNFLTRLFFHRNSAFSDILKK